MVMFVVSSSVQIGTIFLSKTEKKCLFNSSDHQKSPHQNYPQFEAKEFDGTSQNSSKLKTTYDEMRWVVITFEPFLVSCIQVLDVQ